MKRRGVIFVSGVYGVGKSTLCGKLAKKLGLSTCSASELISTINGEEYGANKAVRDKNVNQKILIEAIEDKLNDNDCFILAGHFCLFNSKNDVEKLPVDAFEEMHNCSIILLEAELNDICENLQKRDGKNYSPEKIRALQMEEASQAQIISERLRVPLIKYHMSFSCYDEQRIIELMGD